MADVAGPSARAADLAHLSDREILEWMAPDGAERAEVPPPAYRQALRSADLWSGPPARALERLLQAARAPEVAGRFPASRPKTKLPESGLLRFESFGTVYWRGSNGTARSNWTLRWHPTKSWLAYGGDHQRRVDLDDDREPTPWFKVTCQPVPPAEARRLAELLLGLAEIRFQGPRGSADKSVYVSGYGQESFELRSDRGATLASIQADVTGLPGKQVPWKAPWSAAFTAFFGSEVLAQELDPFTRGRLLVAMYLQRTAASGLDVPNAWRDRIEAELRRLAGELSPAQRAALVVAGQTMTEAASQALELRWPTLLDRIEAALR